MSPTDPVPAPGQTPVPAPGQTPVPAPGSPPWSTGPPPPPPDPSEAGPGPGPAGLQARPRPSGASPASDWLGYLRRASPWTLGAAAAVVAFGGGWLSLLLEAVRHLPRQTARERVLEAFGVGTITWAVIVLLGVALVAAGRRLELATPESRHLDQLVADALVVAGAAAGASAVIDMVVEVTSLGHGADLALAGLFGYIAALALDASACWWAYRLRAGR